MRSRCASPGLPTGHRTAIGRGRPFVAVSRRPGSRGRRWFVLLTASLLVVACSADAPPEREPEAAEPGTDDAMPTIVIERTGGDYPNGFAGSVSISPDGEVERRRSDGNMEVTEESFQLEASHHERIIRAASGSAHHDLPEVLPPGSCEPGRDEIVGTYTFTDEQGETVIDTCAYDVSGQPLFTEVDAVFDADPS